MPPDAPDVIIQGEFIWVFIEHVVAASPVELLCVLEREKPLHDGLALLKRMGRRSFLGKLLVQVGLHQVCQEVILVEQRLTIISHRESVLPFFLGTALCAVHDSDSQDRFPALLGGLHTEQPCEVALHRGEHILGSGEVTGFIVDGDHRIFLLSFCLFVLTSTL